MFGEPVKVTIEYQDMMDLIRRGLGEGGPDWEWGLR